MRNEALYKAVEEARSTLPRNGAQWLVTTLIAIALTLAGFTLSQVFVLNREQGSVDARLDAAEESSRELRDTLRSLRDDVGDVKADVARALGILEAQAGVSRLQ